MHAAEVCALYVWIVCDECVYVYARSELVCVINVYSSELLHGEQ